MKMNTQPRIALVIAALLHLSVAGAQQVNSAKDDRPQQAFLEALRSMAPDQAEYLTFAERSLAARCGQPPSVEYLKRIGESGAVGVTTSLTGDKEALRHEADALPCEGKRGV